MIDDVPKEKTIPNLPGKGSPVVEPLRIVKGKSLTYNDLQDWTPEQYINFFKFIQFFHGLQINEESLRLIEMLPKAQYGELLARAAIPFREHPPNVIEKRIREVIAGFALTVGKYLKENPGLMTESMLEAINKVPRLQSIAKHFKVSRTDTGLVVIEPENSVIDEPQAVKSANAEVSLMESMLKTASIFDMIASTIKLSELKGMDVKDRIAALQKLSFVFSLSQKSKPNSNVFNKINIITANKDQLEKSILDFANEEQSNNQ